MADTRQPNAPSGREKKEKLTVFNAEQLRIINEAVSTAEELVSNFYKMSATQWLRLRYDVRTLANLREDEIVHGPFAQVIRYEAKRQDTALGSSVYDFYKICLQDHSILSAVSRFPHIRLFPFVLYVVTHELIHIVRFCKFLQQFDASADERAAEEARVHERTHRILRTVRVRGIREVLKFYRQWCEQCEPLEKLR